MAKIHRTTDPEMYILIMEKEEAKALGKMIEGASLEKRRWFDSVLYQLRKMELI